MLKLRGRMVRRLCFLVGKKSILKFNHIERGAYKSGSSSPSEL